MFLVSGLTEMLSEGMCMYAHPLCSCKTHKVAQELKSNHHVASCVANVQSCLRLLAHPILIEIVLVMVTHCMHGASILTWHLLCVSTPAGNTHFAVTTMKF